MMVQLPNERNFTELDIDESQFKEESRTDKVRFGWYKGLFIGIKLMLLAMVGQAQTTTLRCDSGYKDTARMTFCMKLYLYDYYNANGVRKRAGRKEMDSTLIPNGGYVRIRKKDKHGIDGYGVMLVIDNRCHTSLLKALDLARKPINGEVNSWWIKEQ